MDGGVALTVGDFSTLVATRDRARCNTCGVDRFVPDTAGKPCAACVNDKHVYVCKSCGVVYMYPQYSPVCGPHFCKPEHILIPQEDGEPRALIRARMVWHPNDVILDTSPVYELQLPIWSCGAQDVARALLANVRVTQFLALDQPYANGKWTHAMEQKFRVAPHLVAADSTLVSDYIARSQGDASTMDVMRYLCDELRICTRAHPAHAIMDHVPGAHENFTVGQLLTDTTTLADYMDASDFYAFTYTHGAASRLDGDKHAWIVGSAMVINVASAHAITLAEPVPAPPAVHAAATAAAPVAQKQPMSGVMQKKNYDAVDAWCRIHGAPCAVEGSKSGSYLPVTRNYDSVRCVNSTNFIAQLSGIETHVQRTLDDNFPHVPSISYPAARAQRSLVLIPCASTEERDARIIQLRDAVSTPPATKTTKARTRVINRETMRLLRMWLPPPPPSPQAPCSPQKKKQKVAAIVE